VRDVWFFCFV